jgi:hypothetical protein
MSDQYASGNKVNFYGNYSGGANLANHTVTVAGPGWSATAVTNSSGSWRVQVAMTASSFGTITASMDDPGANQPQITLNEPAAPAITNFQALPGPDGGWEFKGDVTNTPDPYGMLISFGGIPGLVGETTYVRGDGSFDVWFTLGNVTGTASAVTTDWWNQTSQTVYADL